MNKFDQLLKFLEEYAIFFEGIFEDEKKKLEVLMNGRLKDIEKTISIQQANEKKIQNIEKKREDLQTSLGYQGLTFKQVIELYDGEEKKNLQTLFVRIESAINNVKFYNKKGMEIASTNLHLFGEQNKHDVVYSKDTIGKK